jgi:hypothetical protein
MTIFRLKNPSSLAYCVAIIGLVIVAGFTRVMDFDIWWHLKTGEVISLIHRIPRFDIFSYTAMGRPWINHEWLFQVFSWSLFSNFGIASLTMIQFFITAALAIIAFKTCTLLVRNRNAALWCATFTILFIADRIIARPYLISLLFTAIFAYQLHSFSIGRKRQLYELPLVMLVWINCHGGGIIGPQMIIAYAIGESIQHYLSKKHGMQVTGSLGGRRLRHIWIIGALSLFTCLVTPFGLEAFLFPIRHLGMTNILAFTQEWLPVLDPRIDGVVSQIAFRIILVLTPISYIVGRKDIRLPHLMLTILTCMLILKGKRFTPDFIVINLPMIFYNLRDVARRIPVTRGAEIRRAWSNIFIVFMVSVFAFQHGIPATIRGGTVGELGIGTTRTFAPFVADFIIESGLKGKMFNEMSTGGYLILRLWPDQFVFIDGRTPIYGDAFFEEYICAMHDTLLFDRFTDKYDFDYLVFSGHQAWDLRSLHYRIWERGLYKLVYADFDGFVYVKDIPRYKKLIKTYELKQNPLIEEMKRTDTMFFINKKMLNDS